MQYFFHVTFGTGVCNFAPVAFDDLLRYLGGYEVCVVRPGSMFKDFFVTLQVFAEIIDLTIIAPTLCALVGPPLS